MPSAEYMKQWHHDHPGARQKWDESHREQYLAEHKGEAETYRRKWAAANPYGQLRYTLKKHYDMSLDDYFEMVNQQLGLCAICKKPETLIRNGKIQRLSVDHSHATNKVRALLCSHCNIVLGQAQESVHVLQASIEYLNSFNQ